MDEIQRLFRDRINLYQEGRFKMQLSWEDFKKEVIDFKQRYSWNYRQTIVNSIVKVRKVLQDERP